MTESCYISITEATHALWALRRAGVVARSYGVWEVVE